MKPKRHFEFNWPLVQRTSTTLGTLPYPPLLHYYFLKSWGSEATPSATIPSIRGCKPMQWCLQLYMIDSFVPSFEYKGRRNWHFWPSRLYCLSCVYITLTHFYCCASKYRLKETPATYIMGILFYLSGSVGIYFQENPLSGPAQTWLTSMKRFTNLKPNLTLE